MEILFIIICNILFVGNQTAFGHSRWDLYNGECVAAGSSGYIFVIVDFIILSDVNAFYAIYVIVYIVYEGMVDDDMRYERLFFLILNYNINRWQYIYIAILRIRKIR